MTISGMRILVTGGAGFIGSHLVKRLLQDGARVRVLDNFSSGTMDNLADIAKDVEIIRGDVRDADAVKKAVQGCEVVNHQAAQLEITRCIDDPIDDLQSNTVATINVLNAAVKADVARVIYASSACVYGQPVYLPSDEAKHPTNPNWAYGVSKLACEKYAGVFHEQTGIPMSGLRYGIVYGPREWYGRVLTIFLKRLSEGKPPVVFGKGDQQRDFTFVGDVVALHMAILDREIAGHEIFNVSTGLGTTIVEMGNLAIDATGVKQKIVYENVQPGQRSKIVDEQRLRLPSELQAMVLDPTKARELLGWSPKVDLRDGLKLEWDWLLEHRDRWRKMSY
jgi:UDP-glucose 4-epimerase